MNWYLSCIALFIPVVLSGLLVFAIKITDTRLKLILSFSGAYILALSLLHLLPELYEGENPEKIGIYILAGFFVQLLLEYFSSGIEHGHAHIHTHTKKIPFSILAGLFIHSMLEGMPISQKIQHVHEGSILNFSDSLVVGIILHNIPISIAFMSMMLHMGMKKNSAIGLLILFALMAPLGCFISQIMNWSGVEGFEKYLKIALALVIGIFLHISTTIMFESSEKNHKYQLSKILSIIVGAAVAWGLS
ncbi:MAG: ZIP family metal transporter [Bacteroidia bacterium]|nr:ZIP family metal transporter [Bacteroidia bacterium]